MQKKILAVASHPGGANAIIPVARRLKEQDYYILIQQTNALVGVSNDDVCTGTPYDRRWSLENLVDVFKRELDSDKIDVVLMGTASQKTAGKTYLEQAYTLAAKEKGIPTVAVVDLSISEVERFSDIYDENEKFKFMPSKICSDKIAYDRMLAKGFPSDRLVATGNPYFDNLGELVRDQETHRRLARQIMGVDASNHVIVYASDVRKDLENLGWGFTDSDCINAVCRGIIELPRSAPKSVVLVLKKHPREEQKNFDELCRLAASYDVQLHTSAYNIRHDLLGSDLGIGIVSTALLEATMMGKDAISLQPNPERAKTDDYFLNTLDLIPHAYGPSECKELVKIAVSSREFWTPYRNKRQYLKTDGKATERVVEVVKSLIK